MTPEFARRVPLDTIGQERVMTVEANEAERQALARRFDLRALSALSAEAVLRPSAMGIEVSGRIHATVVQACVITGVDVPGTIDEDFGLRFVAPDMLATGNEEERELGSGDLDLLAHDGSAIDLGEAVAQTLGLALDPFPRAPGPPAGQSEERRWTFGPEASPFAGLKGLLG